MISELQRQIYYAQKAVQSWNYTIAPGVIACACLVLEPYLPGAAYLAPILAGGCLYLSCEPAALSAVPPHLRDRMRGWVFQLPDLGRSVKGLSGGEMYLKKLNEALELFWRLSRLSAPNATLEKVAWGIDTQFKWLRSLLSLAPKLNAVGDSTEYALKLDMAMDVFRESLSNGAPGDTLVTQAKEIDDLLAQIDAKLTEVMNTTNQANAQEGLHELFRVKQEILSGLDQRQQAEKDVHQLINEVKN